MINLNDIMILPILHSNNKFIGNQFYPLYCDYQRELRIVAPDINDEPIESEIECVHHACETYNYLDNFIFCKNEIVGLICFQNVDNLDDYKAPILYLDHLYIKPEFRRKGFAKAAIDKLLNTYNKYHVFFYVLKNNAPAQSFWRHYTNQAYVRKIDDPRCLSNAEYDGETNNCDKFIISRANH